MKKRTLLLLFLTLGFAKAVAQVPVQRCVYMFGFAASFVDSTAYITDIQAIDSAFIFKKNGFLADRSLYSAQLDQFLQTHMQKEDMTCVVFFDEQKSKLEKTFLKIRKKYLNDKGVLLTPLGKDIFTFTAEEWFDPAAIEMPSEETVEVVEEVTAVPEGGDNFTDSGSSEETEAVGFGWTGN